MSAPQIPPLDKDGWPEWEEGVCVCCKAATILTWQMSETAKPTPVCPECKEDGTFVQWLAAELERHAESMGWSHRLDEKTGRKLWTIPAEEDAS